MSTQSFPLTPAWPLRGLLGRSRRELVLLEISSYNKFSGRQLIAFVRGRDPVVLTQSFPGIDAIGPFQFLLSGNRAASQVSLELLKRGVLRANGKVYRRHDWASPVIVFDPRSITDHFVCPSCYGQVESRNSELSLGSRVPVCLRCIESC